MINTSRQLKALVRNRSGGNSAKAQTIIRNYIMERMLERISLSEIIKIEVEDGITFSIKRVSEIMEEAEYPGVRAMLEAQFDTMRTPLKIDISTGDVITPKEIQFEYKLMFEDRTISIYAYNIETVLAEKLETVISRGTVNTRLRDYYDLYVLQQEESVSVDLMKLKIALKATCWKRESLKVMESIKMLYEEIAH